MILFIPSKQAFWHGDERMKEQLTHNLSVWTETFDDAVDSPRTDFMSRQLPEDTDVPAVEQFYKDTIYPLVLEVRQHLVSQLKNLYRPLVNASRRFEQSTRLLMFKHLQPCANILHLYVSGVTAQATLLYQCVFSDMRNDALTFVNDDALLAWKSANVTERMLLLSSASDIVLGLKCDVNEFMDVTGFIQNGELSPLLLLQ